MSKFLSTFTAEDTGQRTIEGRVVWRVVAPLIYTSDVLGKTITVETGFLTDGESAPRLPLVYLAVGDVSFSAAVVHDWLYHHHEICDKATADQVLFEAMAAEGGIAWWKRKAIYLGVKWGGESSWKEDGAGDGHSFKDGKII